MSPGSFDACAAVMTTAVAVSMHPLGAASNATNSSSLRIMASEYPFDEPKLKQLKAEYLKQGEVPLAAGEPTEAVEPLRKAYVFADRLFGMQDPETLRAKEILDRRRDKAALARLRFRQGDTLLVRDGPHAG
jgi:hypothetical protein